jgi:hypothetical protein
MEKLDKTLTGISAEMFAAGELARRGFNVTITFGNTKAIALCHDFYEVDYLSENDLFRSNIDPGARKEVLKRLLQLNHERYAEEVAAGLHDKKTAKKEPKAVKWKSTDGGLFGEREMRWESDQCEKYS